MFCEPPRKRRGSTLRQERCRIRLVGRSPVFSTGCVSRSMRHLNTETVFLIGVIQFLKDVSSLSIIFFAKNTVYLTKKDPFRL